MERRASERFATLPGLLRHVADATASSWCLNWREGGYWRRMATEELAATVRRLSLGLVDLGLKPGETVGILAAPSPWWLVADLAILCAGAISVPMFPNLSAEHIAFESKNAGLRMLIVIGEQGWQAAQPHLKLYRTVVAKGVGGPLHQAIDWQAAIERGDRRSIADPGAFARARDAIDADAVATVIHTSGSTGYPKGVQLTHRNLVSQVQAAGERFPLDPARDRAFTCLPLAHVMERMVMYYYLASGVQVFFCDDIKGIGALLREVQPTVMTMVPRLVEKLYARIEQGIEEGWAGKKRLGRWAMRLANDGKIETERTPAERIWSLGVADAFVYRRLRAALGGHLRYLIVGGAPLSIELTRFLINIGIPLYIGYGLTESAPTLAAHYPGHRKPGSVGQAMPGVELRIGAQDEILARGPNVMRGYLNAPDATAAAIDADGWLHTGDMGRLDDEGYLFITGRLKELLKTSNGKYVSPVPIEQGLLACPLIDGAMVVAEGRRFVSCLLFPNLEVVRARRLAAGLGAINDVEYLARPDVAAEIDQLVAGVNRGLDQWEQVRRWRFTPRPPSVEEGELTPTLKIRRHVVAERYRDLIEDMYRGDEPPAADGTPLVKPVKEGAA